MRLLKNISLCHRAILYTLVVCMVFGCKDEKEKLDPLIQMQKRLRGTWIINEVTLSETDVSIFYDELTLTFNSNYSFACENEVDPVWPANGTYENIIENDLQIIIREDGIRMKVISLTQNNLIVQFSWAGIPTGKVKSLNGEYEFTFTKL